jgi:hypothetical protein
LPGVSDIYVETVVGGYNAAAMNTPLYYESLCASTHDPTVINNLQLLDSLVPPTRP